MTSTLSEFLGADGAVRPGPRTLVIAAHPDDEVIGAGARLGNLRDVFVVHVTDGAPRDPGDALAQGFGSPREYARARREEALAALSLAGVTADRVACLGVTDQEAAYDLPGLTRALVELVRRRRPGLVVTHPYEGGHPDHDAAAYAVDAALRRLRTEGVTVPAAEFTSYHAAGEHMVAADFLPGDTAVSTVALPPAARDLKRRMFACFGTQRAVLDRFAIDVERFRATPGYDFTQAPHAGPRFQERFRWGLSAAQWAGLVRAARESPTG